MYVGDRGVVGSEEGVERRMGEGVVRTVEFVGVLCDNNKVIISLIKWFGLWLCTV